MLGYLQRFLRQFKNLALFITHHRFTAQGVAVILAAGAALQGMDQDVVGLGNLLEGFTRVARLATRLASAFPAERFGSRFGQAIAGGRLAAVATVEGQTFFEFFNLGVPGQILGQICR